MVFGDKVLEVVCLLKWLLLYTGIIQLPLYGLAVKSDESGMKQKISAFTALIMLPFPPALAL
jgi:hypothetical protein